MERARATWTDRRLDDLAHRMDDGFNRVDADIRELRAEIGARFDAVNGRFDSVDARFDASQARADERFDAFQRTILQLGGGMIVTFVVGFAGLLAAQLA
jgi:hypothetical protein